MLGLPLDISRQNSRKRSAGLAIAGHTLDTELLESIARQMQTGTQVVLNSASIPVSRTSSQRLKTLQFQMNGREYHAIEQNPAKPSRWGQLAREGHHVVQFRDVKTNRYVAVAVDGVVKEYSTLRKRNTRTHSDQ